MLSISDSVFLQEYEGLDALSLSDVVELVEQSRETLDDVWRQTEFQPYPEARMVRLMDVIGGNLPEAQSGIEIKCLLMEFLGKRRRVCRTSVVWDADVCGTETEAVSKEKLRLKSSNNKIIKPFSEMFFKYDKLLRNRKITSYLGFLK